MAPPRRIFLAVIRGHHWPLEDWFNTDLDRTREVNEYFLYDDDGYFEDDVNPQDDSWRNLATLLHCAVCPHVTVDGPHFARDQRDVVRLLLEHGADANAADSCGSTPLHHSKSAVLSEMLLDAGANVNARSGPENFHATPLMLVFDDDLELVRLLVSRGADLSLTDSSESARDAEVTFRGGRVTGSPRCADFLAGVKAAGSWRRYVRAPRVELLLLRFAVARGRATPPPVRLRTLSPETVIFERLFGASAEDPRALPLEVFWLVLAFWRTDRDI